MIEDVLQQLSDALSAVPELRVYPLGAAVDPPGAIVGPPTFAYDAFAPVATGATVPVTLAVQADDRALSRLLALLPAAQAAIDAVPSCAVRTATPGVLPAEAGGAELPAYLLEIEVSL